MKILIVDDEINIRMTLKDILEDEGYQTCVAGTGEKAIKIASKESIDMMILDVKLPGIDGIETFTKIHKDKPELDVLMISGHSDISTAVSAVKIGAYDFLEKPLSMIKILTAVRNIKEKQSLKNKVVQEENAQYEKNKLIGESPQIKNVLSLIEKVAPTDSKVLIRGESGTGKELVAYAIHHNSTRNRKMFIKFNSAAIPSSLVESELFGHEKGAFTGADSQKLGKLEQANHGTLFLDEIGDMDLSVQAKILRVIQEGTFERVGGNQTINIDVRLIAATHKNLEEMTQRGTFRDDLFYRLNVIPISIPPLREREGDIEILTEYFLEYYSREFKTQKKTILPSAMENLVQYSLPGNIRELKNIIERLCILVTKDFITKDDIAPHLLLKKSSSGLDITTIEGKTFKDVKTNFEKQFFQRQLKENHWNISLIAKKLGMQQPNLSRKIKELGLTK
ncbi:MAG: sigma-54 dependent transcriptional regulator [Candidatus Marinimicrobia bacterium]|nr:sigma-54 dependent transcriptional regulator [Candidatus Neomarinimicrobiota bacterium]